MHLLKTILTRHSCRAPLRSAASQRLQTGRTRGFPPYVFQNDTTIDVDEVNGSDLGRGGFR